MSHVATYAAMIRDQKTIVFTYPQGEVEIAMCGRGCLSGECIVSASPQTAAALDLDTGFWKTVEGAVANMLGVRL